MTISAVNTDRLDMVLVAEWHRLIDRKTDVADIVDAIDVQQNAEQQPDDSIAGLRQISFALPMSPIGPICSVAGRFSTVCEQLLLGNPL